MCISLIKDRTSLRFCSANGSPPRMDTLLIYGLSINFKNLFFVSFVHSLPLLKSHVSGLKQFLQCGFLSQPCVKTAQLILEYNNSYIRFRNDGSSFYIMNGNASSWTNYITFQSTGAVVVPSTLQVPTCLYVPYATTASTTSAANAYISADGNGVLAKTSKTSSRRFKDSITTDLDEELNPEHLYNIDVVQFKYKKDYFTNRDDIRYRKNLIGLIAENVYDNYKIAADWHVDEESGKILVDAWNEQYIVPAMLKLIQEQHKEIEKLKQIIGGEVINEG